MNFRVFWVTVSLVLVGQLYAAAADASGGASDSTSTTTSASTKPDYILHPQDQIKVQVFQEEDINKQTDGLSLSQDCKVTLPLIGTISLRGKTVGQAEEMIRDLYNRDYIVNPQVSVTVVKYADRSVNVIGSVTNQGRIKFPEERDLSILDAISLAGGQTRLADMKHVKLTRNNGEAQIIDVDAMMKKGGADPVMLEPGDVIYVPERIL